jgi:urease accessory protein UreF
MSSRSKWKKALLMLSLCLFAFSAEAAFNADMTSNQVKSEISAMLVKINPLTGKAFTLTEVADAAKTAGIQANTFATAVIANGADATLAVAASIAAWGQAEAPGIVSAAIAAAPTSTTDVIRVANALAPDQSQAIQTAALAVPGVDPSVVMAATAAGPAAAATIAALTAAAAAPGGGAGGGGGGGIASPA